MTPGDASALPPVRGGRLLELLERPVLALGRVGRAVLPDRLNPFAQTGAIAATTFIVASVTGVFTLLWYRASVHDAFSSVEAMTAARWTGGIVRSLHRYSSDACMLFAGLHAIQYFTGKRFTGPRWVPWVTGIGLVGLLWFVGWLGYWLVWDERGQLVALGTAALFDQLPVFAEPLSRSFLTDDSVNSLLFFMVFFAHMLLPLAMGVVLWLHIMRLSRARYLTGRTMTLWVMGTLLVASIVWPATSAGPARMGVMPDTLTLDAWYLLPLALTERLGGGALWAVTLVSGLALTSLPWTLARGRVRVAEVDPDRCNACENCYVDCPYDAIAMVPRPDGGRRSEALVARVDPDRCVGCGICAGSCNSAGIGLPWKPSVDQRRRQDAWLAEDAGPASEGSSGVAFVCAHSAGAGLAVDPESGRAAGLEGYRVEPVPCIGWVHALTVERALRHGARDVVLLACGQCVHREGLTHTEARMAGDRVPALRLDKVEPKRVQVKQADSGESLSPDTFFRPADFAPGGRRAAPPPRWRVWTGGAALAVVLGAVMVVASDARHVPPPAEPALVVSFNHPGERGEDCRTLTPEELAARPPHMRQPQICERRRAPVRLRVTVDGTPHLDETYAPGGLSEDGTSVAMARLPLPAGAHRVRVEIGDTLDESRWPHVDERTIELSARERRVVLFDRRTGFRWY